MIFKIYAGLSGGFGGANYHFTGEFDSEEEAVDEAYRLACEEYDGMAGLHGLRDYSQIAEEDGLEDEDEIEQAYREEMESWIDYYVVLTDSLEDTDE